MFEAGSPCSSLLAHMDDSRQYRDNVRQDVRELYQRTDDLAKENAEQTAILQNNNDMLKQLVEKSDATYAAYQAGRGVLWVLGGLGAGVVALPSLIDVFHRLFGGGK